MWDLTEARKISLKLKQVELPNLIWDRISSEEDDRRCNAPWLIFRRFFTPIWIFVKPDHKSDPAKKKLFAFGFRHLLEGPLKSDCYIQLVKFSADLLRIRQQQTIHSFFVLSGCKKGNKINKMPCQRTFINWKKKIYIYNYSLTLLGGFTTAMCQLPWVTFHSPELDCKGRRGF